MTAIDTTHLVTLEEAEHLARSLMDAHGLQDWAFGWDRARTRFGYCHWWHHRITLSRELTPLRTVERVIDTILHEIAHALVGPCLDGPHGAEWKDKAAKLGAIPRACTSENPLPGRFLATCAHCGHQWRAHRRTRLACTRCCRQHNGGRFTTEYLVVWTEAD